MNIWPDRTPATCPSTLRVQRPCVECGGSFLIAPNIAERYLTCSRSCSSSRRSKMKLEALNPLWRGDGCRKETARARARRRFTLVGFVCEECGAAAAVDRHHKDGQPRNNDPANIARLCRRCHMLVDGRLEKFLVSRYDGRRCLDEDEIRSAVTPSGTLLFALNSLGKFSLASSVKSGARGVRIKTIQRGEGS